ncbi:MAG TPA: hypothetical protein VGJ22_01430 [Anaerolineales bacterium]
MKIKILFATLLILFLFTTGYAQTLDKAKLDQMGLRYPGPDHGLAGRLGATRAGNTLALPFLLG